MGRSKSNPVSKYFTYIDRTDLSQCEVPGCNMMLKGKHSANLERHLQRRHPEDFHHLQLMKLEPKRKISETRFTSIKVPVKQTKLEDVKLTIAVSIAQQTLVDACIELVTINSRPLNLINDSGFRKIVDPIICGLGGQLNINDESIQHLIATKAETIRDSIMKELKGKLLSIKIDCVQKMGRHIIGIYVQYIKNTRMVLQTLAIIELDNDNTSKYLEKMLLKTLERYEICIDQLYSVTMSDGSLLNKDVPLVSEYITDAESVDISGIKVSQPYSMPNNNELFNDSNIKKEHDAGNIKMNAEKIAEETEFYLGEFEERVTVVRCPGLTLENAVNEALQSEIEFITKTQEVYKKLLKKSITDNQTLWGSTYEVMQQLLELKDFCNGMALWKSEFHLSETDWEHISSIVESLIPVKEAFAKLENDQLVMGDFYGIWWNCYTATRKLETSMARSLCEAMQKREGKLFESNVSRAAIFLDPRYQCVLSTKCKEAAKIHLLNMWDSYKSMMQQDPLESHSTSESNNEDDSDDLEMMLKSRKGQNQDSSFETDMLYVLNAYDHVAHVHHKTSIFGYWESEKGKRQLYDLAYIALSVPSTQNSLKRSYSAIDFIFSNLNSTVQDEHILDNVMIIRGYTK
ncbi:PREDICTED: uncharacterized protein LOC108565083 [Nicrophorus vespilloides]|uniref:Uncharacterized protein LOC108565083 n=1 Tax=Nicrophorus vespilloides TaxID=110193 RepID=A0ABM1MZ54_NICVS|nr:PREDICTED: uncharacterized protein LOC108565083 [Nicrophorus vespilloides]XP_017779854.1 PREDICTED: uncharacterized protein LOC108565083 [Nicrophorus vespilloides]